MAKCTNIQTTISSGDSNFQLEYSGLEVGEVLFGKKVTYYTPKGIRNNAASQIAKHVHDSITSQVSGRIRVYVQIELDKRNNGVTTCKLRVFIHNLLNTYIQDFFINKYIPPGNPPILTHVNATNWVCTDVPKEYLAVYPKLHTVSEIVKDN